MTTDLCPWLGTAEDNEIRHAEASDAHVCHAQPRPVEIKQDYQSRFCLGSAHRSCAFYREPDAAVAPDAPKPEADEVGLRRGPRWWTLALWLLSLLLLAVVLYPYVPSLLERRSRTAALPSQTIAEFPTETRLPSATPSQPAAVPATDAGFVEATPTQTPFPGGAVYRLAPEARAAGWVASDETSGNHLGDSYLYSGVFDGVIYHGVIQFDLSAVPAGAQIHAGVLELSGLDRLRVVDGGVWEVRILSSSDVEWGAITYQMIHSAPVEWALAPALTSPELQVGRVNGLALPAEVLQGIEGRLLEGKTALSIRLDGPLAGSNNVFAWDAGYGPATRGDAPRIVLNVGPAPETPVPTSTPRYVVVTSTPTPGNVLTAAAMVQTATAAALRTGQPQAGSVVYWTATPIIVVTSAPTPANQATADYQRAVATAVAMTTGTYTPTPVNMVTATPTAGTQLPATATHLATSAPSVPPVTPIWTTTPPSTPRPSTGTPTPAPLSSATPTPVSPSGLEGSILFLTDRDTQSPWVTNPDGTGLSRMPDRSAYEAAGAAEPLSPDGTKRTFVGQIDGMQAVFVAPLSGGQATPLVAFQDASLQSPVWAPVGDWIAFVAVSQNTSQIWLIRSTGTGLRELTYQAWGAASHPTFSPDGQSLAYANLSAPGRRQLWVIRLDGSSRFNLSDDAHDDWDPLWVK